jgi:Bacterial Ig-like domain (group 1)
VNRLAGVLGSFAIIVAGFAGCGGDDLVLPGSGTPADLSIAGGDDQTGPAGSPLALPLRVLVADDQGTPLGGHTVVFALEGDPPGARLDPENARSGSDGIASTAWFLGATAGTQTVVARVARAGSAEPLEVRFSASVAAAGAANIAIAGGDDQLSPAGSLLIDPLVVVVSDGFGNPVEGVTVEWSAGGGTVEPASSVTRPDGRAQTAWTLGPTTGSQVVTATSGSLTGSPLTFDATALPGDAERLVRISEDDQSATAGTELPEPLVVQLLDNAGNGVPDRAVSWIVATGGGSVAPETSMTDGEGKATARWTLGPGVGPVDGANTLNAVVSGVGFVAFRATGTSSGGGGGGGGGSTASRLEFRVQPSDTEEHETMSPSVQVAVLDQNGNLVTDRDFAIKLELLDDEDKPRAEGTSNTRSGVATFTIRVNKEGEYRLRASTNGLPSIFSTDFEVEDD